MHAHFTTKDGFKLGSWVSSRRRGYKNGQLTPDRIDALNALGFIWDPFEDDYQRGLGYLKAYKAEHGDCRVPLRFTTKDGFKLGKWVSRRRNDYKIHRLTLDRIEALNALGFIWDQLEDDYQKGLGYLKAYKTEHGDCRVPQRFRTKGGFQLGTWVTHRRNDYKVGRLTPDRIDALNKLGFIWSVK